MSPPAPSPRVAAYLSALPHGAASHPQCVARAAMLRRALADRPLTRDQVEALPAPVRAVATCPPLDGEWVSDVHLVCTLFAAADAHGLRDDAYLEWMRDLNLRMFESLFRTSVAAESPEEVLARAPERWSIFHRGSTLSVTAQRPGWARVRLAFPPSLFHGLALRQFAPVFEAALRISEPSGRVACAGEDEIGGEFLVTWAAASP